MGNFKKAAGQGGRYHGPGTGLKNERKVGVGQAAPPKGKEESAKHERAESPAKERAEEKAAKKVGSGAMMPGIIGGNSGMGTPRMGAPPPPGPMMGGGGPMGPLPPVSGGPMGGGMAPPMKPPVPKAGAGKILPAGRRSTKLARKVPTMFKAGK